MDNTKNKAAPDVSGTTGKVGFVIGSLMRGGAEMHLVQLLPALKNKGWDVSIFLISATTGPLAKELEKEDIEILPKETVHVPQWLPTWLRRATRFALLGPKFIHYSWQHRQGIVHFFLPESFIIGGLLSFPWRRHLVMSRRSMTTYRAKYPPIVTSIEKFLQHRMDLLLGNSVPVVEQILHDGVPEEKVRLIYNGLIPERLDPPDAERTKLRNTLKLSKSELVFITLANLIPYKGHTDLIEALGKLDKSGRLPENWSLLLIGRDSSTDNQEIYPDNRNSYRAKLENICRQANLSSHVHFLGERPDAPALLRCADIAVFPSHEEGFSNALIEKMAAGLAIVATDVGGNSEALDKGRAGIIVPPQNPDALADALLYFIDAPDTRQYFGKIAHDRALQSYTIEQCARNYEDVYREILDHS